MEKISVAQTARALRDSGLSEGDTVFVHADLIQFGLIKDKNGKFDLALGPATLATAMKRVLGTTGTIVVPTFSYTWPKEAVFRVAKTKSLMGSFSEYIRALPEAMRTPHPLLSITAVGSRAKNIVAGVDKTGFGKGSPFSRLHALNAKLVMAGVPYCSIKDFVELSHNVPYRYTKYFHGTLDSGSSVSEEIFQHSVRYLDQQVDTISFFEGLPESEKQKMKSQRIGKGLIRCLDSRSAYRIVSSQLAHSLYSYLKKTPTNAGLFSLIQELGQGLASGKGRIRLDIFAVHEEGIEKWIIALAGVKNNTDLSSRLSGLAAPRVTQWWSSLSPPDTEFIISLGDDQRAGAEIVLSVAEMCVRNRNQDDDQGALRMDFVEKILTTNPAIYQC